MEAGNCKLWHIGRVDIKEEVVATASVGDIHAVGVLVRKGRDATHNGRNDIEMLGKKIHEALAVLFAHSRAGPQGEQLSTACSL